MFTGIIQATSHVASVVKKDGGLEVTITAPRGWRLKRGESISVNGVCSTVARSGPRPVFFYMPETLVKTYFANLRAGTMVNLERSLKARDRLDGHIVQGHVDVVGTIKGIKQAGSSNVLTIAVPGNTSLIAEKGSIAVEGVSLTVVDAGPHQFSVHLIPYTGEHTNFQSKKISDPVNLEFDILAKYLERLVRH